MVELKRTYNCIKGNFMVELKGTYNCIKENFMVELKRTYNCIKEGMTIKNICRHLWGKVDGKGSRRISIFLTFRCNLSCPYCISEIFSTENCLKRELDGKSWVTALNRYDRDVYISGGEPTMHKDIWYILQNIKPSLQVKVWTNMAFDIDEFLDKVTRPIYWNASYHPSSGPPQKTINKILKLRSLGKWDNYGEIHTVGFNNKVVKEFECAGIKLNARDFFQAENNETAESVLCKHYGFFIGPDGFRYVCSSKMLRGLGKRENILTDTLRGIPTIVKCNDYPFCESCDLVVRRITRKEKKCSKKASP